MVTSKIPSSLNSENPNMSMGCYRHLGAVAGKQSKSKIEDDIENAFERASTIDELKRAFKAMESVLDDDDKRLGLACLRIGQEFESAGMSPETVLAYAKRALRIFETDAKDSVMIAMALHLMGTVHYTLKKFDESLGYLNRANKLLEKLEKEGTQFQTKQLDTANVQIQLFTTATTKNHELLFTDLN
jgi:tetratricopeptide (TPR) repeat protein